MIRMPLPISIVTTMLLSLAAGAPGFAQTLRIAMTAADIPTTSGIPNNGGEGYRFLGFPAFDGLVDWDFTHPNQIAGLAPGLATAWKIDPADHTRWVFTLRQGVKFTDGSDVTADAIVWNLQRLYDDKSPQFDPAGLGDRAFLCQHARSLAEGRRPHDRDLHQIAVQLFPIHGPQHPDREPGRMGEVGA